MSYRDLLLDPRWQKKRLQILERDKWMCCGCRSTEKTLHVHHRLYRKGAKPWEYQDSELHTLCKDCHEKHHQLRARLDEALGQISDSTGLILGFAEGIAFLLTDKPREGYPLADRHEELGDGWLHGFGSAVNVMFGFNEEALLGLADNKGMLNRNLVMGLQRSVTAEPRLVTRHRLPRGTQRGERIRQLEDWSCREHLSPEEVAEWAALAIAERDLARP